MQPSQDDDLFQLLVKAKLAGTKHQGGGYSFRSNEEAAWTALSVIGSWLQSNVDADQLVIHAALNWYNKIIDLEDIDKRSGRWIPDQALIEAIEKMKGLPSGNPDEHEERSALA